MKFVRDIVKENTANRPESHARIAPLVLRPDQRIDAHVKHD